MNARFIERNLNTQTDWKKLRQKNDADINYSDNPATTADFWKEAKVVMPHRKIHLSVRFDDDIVEYFKQEGRGYQSRMNAVLRAYMNHQKEKAT